MRTPRKRTRAKPMAARRVWRNRRAPIETSSCVPHEFCFISRSLPEDTDQCSAITSSATRWAEPPP
jgi:hypothetical protein